MYRDINGPSSHRDGNARVWHVKGYWTLPEIENRTRQISSALFGHHVSDLSSSDPIVEIIFVRAIPNGTHAQMRKVLRSEVVLESLTGGDAEAKKSSNLSAEVASRPEPRRFYTRISPLYGDNHSSIGWGDSSGDEDFGNFSLLSQNWRKLLCTLKLEIQLEATFIWSWLAVGFMGGLNNKVAVSNGIRF